MFLSIILDSKPNIATVLLQEVAKEK